MTEKIVAALAKLDVTNDQHWTTDGQPKIEALRLLAGDFGLKREDVTKAAPNFSRSHPTTVPVDQGVVTATPIVPTSQENGNAPADILQGSGDSAQEPEQEFEGQDIEAQLSRARARLDAATTAKHQANAVHREAEKEVDRLIEAGAKSAQSDTFSTAITRHFAAQEVIRERRVRQLEQMSDLAKAGISVNDLMPKLRSPLDQHVAATNRQNAKQRAATGS